jgi:8-oxo-dGTP pyrophosphatase MutT (NUDIX family)
MSRTAFKTYEFALVIVRNFDGRWLAVNESRGRGWWIPGGGVDKSETFIEAAHRETREEAGILIKLNGVLRVEHSPVGDKARMRVIFFAEPLDHN